MGLGLAAFLAASIPARLARYALVTVVIGAAGSILRRWFTLRTAQVIHVLAWITFHAWYFRVMTDA